MAEKTPQTYANHTKFDPPFHFFMIPVFAVAALVTLWGAVMHPFNFDRVWSFLMSCAWLISAFKIRIYSLRVQDRVIRLEERMRLATLLPEPLRSRIEELSTSQLVALRFASDTELPALVEKALSANLPNKEIKKAIVNWRPDYQRI